MRKIIHHSQVPKASLNRVRFNEGMEILMWDGWYKVVFNSYLAYGITEDKNKKKASSGSIHGYLSTDIPNTKKEDQNT